MKRTKKKIASEIREEGHFTVIKLFEKDTTLFDCIPDVWFTDENKDSCFWPPIKGKSVALRALKQEIPDESWERFHCEVVKQGFVSYSYGRQLVREKCSQKYNTSSAEEHVNAAKFRRQHPGLSLGVSSGSFEDVFTTKKSSEAARNCQEKTSAVYESSKDDAVIDLEQLAHSESQIPTAREETRHNSPTSVTSYKTVASMASNESKESNTSSSFSAKRRRDRSNSRQRYSLDVSSYSSQSKRSSPNNLPAQNGSLSSLKKGKNVGRQSSSTSHQNKATVLDLVGRSCSQESEQSRASSNFSSKDHCIRSTSGHNYLSNENHQLSGSISLTSITSRCQRPSTSRHNKQANLDRANRSCSSRESENRRNRSASRRSNLSNDTSQRSGSMNLSSTRGRTSSTSRHNKTANFKGDYRRSRSLERKESGSSKRHHIRSSSSQSYCSNSASYARHSKQNLKKTSQGRYESKNSQHSSTGLDGCRSSRKNMLNSCSSSCQSHLLMTKLMENVRYLTTTVCENHKENDRRLTRMEVTMNKTLVRLGDITRTNAAHSGDVSRKHSDEDLRREDTQNYVEGSRQRLEDPPIYGEISRRQRREDARNYVEGSRGQRRENPQSRRVNPREQIMPALPISTLNELSGANQQLMNNDFFAFLINREKEFCTPGKNISNNVVMTTYLRRFISLRVRSLLTLKELQSDQDVQREGYKSANKSLTEKEANEALRIVWGRTKQLLNDEQKKRK